MRSTGLNGCLCVWSVVKFNTYTITGDEAYVACFSLAQSTAYDDLMEYSLEVAEAALAMACITEAAAAAASIAAAAAASITAAASQCYWCLGWKLRIYDQW